MTNNSLGARSPGGADSARPQARLAMRRAAASVRQRQRTLSLLRNEPSNQEVSLATALRPVISRVPAAVPGVRRLERTWRKKAYADDLRRLHDVLEGTDFGDRYWVWGGLLLGWAREGGLLDHDLHDADFAYDHGDHDRTDAAFDALERAGFRRWFRYRNNDGDITQATFIRHGARFEFFMVSPCEDDAEYNQYFVYGSDDTGMPAQLRMRIPRQRLARFDFLERSWQKVDDHESELEFLYGDWRTPDPTWDSQGNGGLLDTSPWLGG
jgi:hypothetical protein